MLNVKIFSLYPELFPGPLDIGIYKKARRKKEPEMNREILATLKPPKSLKLKSNNANNSG